MEQKNERGSKCILSAPDTCNQPTQQDREFCKGCIDILENTGKTVVDINDFDLDPDGLEEIHLTPSLKAHLGLPI